MTPTEAALERVRREAKAEAFTQLGEWAKAQIATDASPISKGRAAAFAEVFMKAAALRGGE